MRQPGGLAQTALQAVKTTLESAARMRNNVKGTGQFSISLARYGDELVDAMEQWERRTRHDGGFRLPSTNLGNDNDVASKNHPERSAHGIFADETWDRGKMVRTFARLEEHSNEVAAPNETYVSALRNFSLSTGVHTR